MRFSDVYYRINKKYYILQLVITIVLIANGLYNNIVIDIITSKLANCLIDLRIENIALAYKVIVMVGGFILVKILFCIITIMLYFMQYRKENRRD
jgi:hypothetical protein